MCKNAAVPIIVMLDHSGLDTEVSDADIETVESNDCRGVLGDNGDGLADKATRDVFALFWKAVILLTVEALPCFWK